MEDGEAAEADLCRADAWGPLDVEDAGDDCDEVLEPEAEETPAAPSMEIVTVPASKTAVEAGKEAVRVGRLGGLSSGDHHDHIMIVDGVARAPPHAMPVSSGVLAGSLNSA